MTATPFATSSTTRPPSQAQQAYEALRDMLIRLQVAPGAPLSEAELTEELGVGRTPLREAINRLAEERLVVKFPRRGTFAAEASLADLPALTELRVELEGLAAEAAARKAGPADREVLQDLRALLVRAGHQGPPQSEMEVDVAIHRAIYAATHNPFLQEAAMRYHNLSTRLWHVFVDRLPDMGDHVGEHEALIRHILAGDAAEAGEVARHHVRNFSEAIRDLL